MIIVDYSTLESPEIREQVKQFVTELLVQHPETLITVVNAVYGAEPVFTDTQLDFWGFPRDAVANNPLTLKTPQLTFKTMFAASIDDRSAEHTVILVIDADSASLDMWRSSGVEFVYNPTEPQPNPMKEHKHG